MMKRIQRYNDDRYSPIRDRKEKKQKTKKSTAHTVQYKVDLHAKILHNRENTKRHGHNCVVAEKTKMSIRGLYF